MPHDAGGCLFILVAEVAVELSYCESHLLPPLPPTAAQVTISNWSELESIYPLPFMQPFSPPPLTHAPKVLSLFRMRLNFFRS